MSGQKVRPDSGSDAGTFQAPAPKPRPKSGKTGEAFGLEGTNKTIAQPKPDTKPAEETVNPDRSRFVPKSPYTRG